MKNAECKIINKLFAVLLVCMLLCGCAVAGDWIAPLVEDYALCRLNSREIVLVQEYESGSGGMIVIDAYVYRVAWNEDFICVQRTDPPEGDEGLPIVPEVDYYILRVSDGTVFGPYTAAEYEKQCDALQITGLSQWKYANDFRP